MDDRYLELEPPRADLGQLQLTNRHEMVQVDSDVLGVVESLKRIDLGLNLFYDLGQDIYVLYHKGLNGQGHVVESLVGAYKELDQRIVNLIERIDAQGRGHADLAAELERIDAERDRENARQRLERVGPLAERLQHALRRDAGIATTASMNGSREKHRQRKRKR